MRPTSLAVSVAAALFVAAASSNPSRAEDASPSDRARQLLARPLTADSVVQIALLNNQALQATLTGIGVFPADLVEAGLLSNSAFAIEPQLAGDDVRAEVSKRFVEVVTAALRKRPLGRAFDGTRRFITQAILDLAADARATFYTLQAAEQTGSSCRDAVEITGVAVDLSQRLHRAGNIDRLEFQTQQRLAAQAQLDLAAAEEVSTETREHLNTVMGLWGPPTSWSIEPRFPDLPAAETPLAAAESLAMEQNLEMAAARQEIVAIAQGRGLAEQLRWVPTAPLEPHGDGGQRPADAAAAAKADLMLPVLDWSADPAPPEQAIFLQKQQRYKALAVDVHSKIRLAYSRLVSARARVDLYRQTVVPLQSETVRQAELRYHAMALGPVELFRIRQEEVNIAIQSITAQRDYWLARTELERQVGCCGDSAEAGRGAAVVRGQTPTRSAAPTSASRGSRP